VSFATITTYQAYLAVHILAAVVWVGGALTVQLFAMRASASGDGQRLATTAADIEFIGTRTFIPASLVLIVFGFLLIHDGRWDYTFWIVFALAVWVASFLVGSAFLGPESGRVNKAIERDGVDHPDTQARIRRIFLVSRIELVFLVLVVLDMALKPGS
jgi:uncharacterized membrane protein